MTWDVLVVGAGPAGSFAALHLARAGLRVALFDRASRGRDKVCGEGLMPRGVAALARAGLGALVEQAPAFDGIALRAGGRRATGRFARGSTRAQGAAPRTGPGADRPDAPPAGPPAASPAALLVGRGVLRVEFDEALALAAAAAGAEVRFGTRVRRIAASDTGCEADTDGERLRAPYLLLADGGRSTLGREIRAARPAVGRLGVVAHAAAGSGATRLVEACFGDGYQVVVTPVVGGACSVAALVEPRRARELSAGATRWLAARVRELGLEAEVDLAAMGPARCVPLVAAAGEPVHGRIVLVGDAAGAVDPIVGCGIALALESAERAAAAIVDALGGDGTGVRAARASLAGYARFRRRLPRLPRLLAGLALATGRHAALARPAARALQGLPAVADALVAAVGAERR